MTRWLILVFCGGAAAVAMYKENLAAFYVSILGYVVIWGIHIIEVKINKLLEHSNLRVTNSEINEG